MHTTEAIERSLLLPAEPRSAGEARRFVSALLEAAGHLEWQEATELAVSEIVTNAVLHAHTALTLTVRIQHDQLRIEVLDHNPALPSMRGYGQQATTGRGMSMVAAVTTTHGVTSLGAEGKVVWFTLGGEPADEDLDALLSGWDDESSPPDPPEGVRVVLVDMPATLWLSARQHHDALLRELALYHAADAAAGDLLVTADLARGAIWQALEGAITEARQRGIARDPLPAHHPASLPEVPPRLDLELFVRAEDASTFGVLQDVLDEAEALAAAEQLLMRPALPEIIAVRDWACEQIIAQLSGMSPTPWPGADAVSDADAQSTRGLPELGWDPTPVNQATRGAVAADDANRILAVSRPFAEALGWDPAELVGRRIVTIIPARLREAHVAGFTRHLATGEAHVLGVPLELPVLRGDGSEVTCAFLIESTATASGRTVYTAWITPLSE